MGGSSRCPVTWALSVAGSLCLLPQPCLPVHLPSAHPRASGARGLGGLSAARLFLPPAMVAEPRPGAPGTWHLSFPCEVSAAGSHRAATGPSPPAAPVAPADPDPGPAPCSEGRGPVLSPPAARLVSVRAAPALPPAPPPCGRRPSRGAPRPATRPPLMPTLRIPIPASAFPEAAPAVPSPPALPPWALGELPAPFPRLPTSTERRPIQEAGPAPPQPCSRNRPTGPSGSLRSSPAGAPGAGVQV